MLHCFQKGLGGNTVFKGYFKHNFLAGAQADITALHQTKHSHTNSMTWNFSFSIGLNASCVVLPELHGLLRILRFPMETFLAGSTLERTAQVIDPRSLSLT